MEQYSKYYLQGAWVGRRHFTKVSLQPLKKIFLATTMESKSDFIHRLGH